MKILQNAEDNFYADALSIVPRDTITPFPSDL